MLLSVYLLDNCWIFKIFLGKNKHSEKKFDFNTISDSEIDDMTDSDKDPNYHPEGLAIGIFSFIL